MDESMHTYTDLIIRLNYLKHQWPHLFPYVDIDSYNSEELSALYYDVIKKVKVENDENDRKTELIHKISQLEVYGPKIGLTKRITQSRDELTSIQLLMIYDEWKVKLSKRGLDDDSYLAAMTNDYKQSVATDSKWNLNLNPMHRLPCIII